MHTLLLLLLRLLLLHNYLLLLLRLIPKNFDVALLTATLILLRYFIRYVIVDTLRAQHDPFHVFCGTRNTIVYAVLAKPSSFHVLSCGTRNTTLPPCMRYSQHYPSLVCGTRNTVLGGTRHTTYSCDVQRYSRHFLLLCGTRNSTLFMCCSAAIAALSVVKRYSLHYLLMCCCGTRTTVLSCITMQHHSHLLLPIVLLGVALLGASTP